MAHLALDNKGYLWSFVFMGWYNTNKSGLCTIHILIYNTPIKGYEMIPVPVFTEWWEE